MTETKKRQRLASAQVVDLVSESEEELEVVEAEPPSSSSSQLVCGMKDTLKCNICMEIYHNPVVIAPCSHMFCGGCFSGWINSLGPQTRPSCPLCRTETTMVLNAPKLVTELVKEYLILFPKEKRPMHELKSLDNQDNVVRGEVLIKASSNNPSSSYFSSNYLPPMPLTFYQQHHHFF